MTQRPRRFLIASILFFAIALPTSCRDTLSSPETTALRLALSQQSNADLTARAKKLLADAEWIGREHNIAIAAVARSLGDARSRNIDRSRLCAAVNESLARHYRERKAHGHLPASLASISNGQEEYLATIGCGGPSESGKHPLSIFPNLAATAIEGDSVEGPLILAPETDSLVEEIKNQAYYATSRSGLETAIAPTLNYAANLDSLSSAVVFSAGSVALSSFQAWSNYFSVPGNCDPEEAGCCPGEDGGKPHLCAAQSIFSPFLLQTKAGRYGRADVAGGLTAIAVGCVRFFYIAVACTNPYGLGGLFLGGSVAASLYEWLDQ